MLTRRALLMMPAAASLLCFLFGASGVSAAAANLPAHGGDGPLSQGASQTGDDDHHCHRGWSDNPGDGGHCCNPTPSPTPAPTPAPRASPARTPSPTPRPRPRQVTPGATRPTGSSPRGSSPPAAGTPTASPSPGLRPPVLAPPALTVPAVIPVNGGGQIPVSVYVVALSTAAVAAVIAIAWLVLIRRSG